MLNHFGCSTITSRTFFRHQDSYLLPAIFRLWDQYQQAFFSQFSSNQTALVLGGDGRADSPGHCAKYGSYTLMELNHNIILDIQLVHTVKNSVHIPLLSLSQGRIVFSVHFF